MRGGQGLRKGGKRAVPYFKPLCTGIKGGGSVRTKKNSMITLDY